MSGQFAGGGGAGPPTSMDPTGIMAIRMAMPGGPHHQMMEANRVPADRRLLEQPWKYPRFFPITIDNVMQYFCQRENPFYDTNSDNALAMMQNPGISGPQLDEILKKMTGIQFVLVVQQFTTAPLFVVRKQQRMGPDKITPLCHYYVLDGTVYQAPDLHTFLNSRLISIMDPLRSAFTETLEMLRFRASKGHSWEFKTKPSKLAEDEEPEDLQPTISDYNMDMKKDKEKDPLNVRATPYQRLRTDMLLQHLATQFKPEKMDVEMPGDFLAQQGPSQRNIMMDEMQAVDFRGIINEAVANSQPQQQSFIP